MRVIDDSKTFHRYCKPLNRFVIIETYNKTSPVDCPNRDKALEIANKIIEEMPDWQKEYAKGFAEAFFK